MTNEKAEVTDEITRPYDSGSKRLLMTSAQELLDLFVPGAHFTGQYSEQFYSRRIEADAMIGVWSEGNEREMVHFEFQSKADPKMAQRMLEYSTLAYSRYECPIRSYVLYLRENNEAEQSPLIRTYCNGQIYKWFCYEEIHLWKMPHRQMLDQDRQGLFPLVPLMDGGANHEVIEEIITRYLPAHDTMSKE